MLAKGPLNFRKVVSVLWGAINVLLADIKFLGEAAGPDFDSISHDGGSLSDVQLLIAKMGSSTAHFSWLTLGLDSRQARKSASRSEKRIEDRGGALLSKPRRGIRPHHSRLPLQFPGFA